MSVIDSFDRFRTSLKGTWKDLPLPANGLTYDLATHLIDQVLVLFGRPQRISAQIENIRGIGSPEVDDTVRPILPDVTLRALIVVSHCSSLSSCTILLSPRRRVPLFSQPR